MSDHGSEFILRFSKLLAQALSMRLHFTSGYHPEANGQSERVNQTLEQYIRMYYNYQQTDWVELLPLAKFTYNNTPSATTGVSPFCANKDYHPRLQVHSLQDLLSKNACFFADKLATVHSELKDVILEAQKYYQVLTNAHRLMPLNYQIGDQVFVLTKFLWTMQPSRKLAKRFLGPFTITGKPSSHSFQVKLPDHLHSVHPVFHVSQLELAPCSSIPNRVNPSPPLVKVNSNLEYKISYILDSRIDCQRKPLLLYYVQWVGYKGTDEENSWISATELYHAKKLVNDFHTQNSAN